MTHSSIGCHSDGPRELTTMSRQRKVTAVESSTFYGIVTNRLVAHVLTPVPSL